MCSREDDPFEGILSSAFIGEVQRSYWNMIRIGKDTSDRISPQVEIVEELTPNAEHTCDLTASNAMRTTAKWDTLMEKAMRVYFWVCRLTVRFIE